MPRPRTPGLTRRKFLVSAVLPRGGVFSVLLWARDEADAEAKVGELHPGSIVVARQVGDPS